MKIKKTHLVVCRRDYFYNYNNREVKLYTKGRSYMCEEFKEIAGVSYWSFKIVGDNDKSYILSRGFFFKYFQIFC